MPCAGKAQHGDGADDREERRTEQREDDEGDADKEGFHALFRSFRPADARSRQPCSMTLSAKCIAMSTYPTGMITIADIAGQTEEELPAAFRLRGQERPGCLCKEVTDDGSRRDW